MFTYNPATDIGKVRLLINDKVDSGHLFEDADIQAMIDLEGGGLKLAAADLLDAVATDQVLLYKCIKLLDLQTDGAKMAKSLREHSSALRQQAIEDGSFDIVEMVDTVFARREKLIKDFQRES